MKDNTKQIFDVAASAKIAQPPFGLPVRDIAGPVDLYADRNGGTLWMGRFESFTAARLFIYNMKTEEITYRARASDGSLIAIFGRL